MRWLQQICRSWPSLTAIPQRSVRWFGQSFLVRTIKILRLTLSYRLKSDRMDQFTLCIQMDIGCQKKVDIMRCQLMYLSGERQMTACGATVLQCLSCPISRHLTILSSSPYLNLLRSSIPQVLSLNADSYPTLIWNQGDYPLFDLKKIIGSINPQLSSNQES